MEPTGISDQLQGRAYGEGFWAQHWLAFVRIGRRLSARRGNRDEGGATAV
jgi:hypothetical protein